MSRDPHDYNYPSNSPYQPLNSNPVIYLDPDGKDYALFIDHDKKSITIKAYYKSSDIEDSREEDLINIGTKFWNSKSEKYDYVFVSNGEELSYSIFIELENINEKIKENPALNNEFFIENVPINTVNSVSNEDWESLKSNGQVPSDALAINFRDKMYFPMNTNNDYSRHEFGHNIGMVHVDRILSLPYTENVMNHSGLSINTSSFNFDNSLGQAGIGVLKEFHGGGGHKHNSEYIGQPLKGLFERNGAIEKGVKPKGFEKGNVK